jgi:Lrp/AsnC family leucine-responsive transcriptional regulator
MAKQRALDQKSWKLLAELQANAQISYSELGRRVGLSTPAVIDRVRGMETVGVITGYHARVNPAAAGYPVSAYIRITVTGGKQVAKRLVSSLSKMREVSECHMVTGDSAYLIRVNVSSIEQLERIVDQLSAFAITSTSVVLSTRMAGRAIPAPVPIAVSNKPRKRAKRRSGLKPGP